MKKLIAVIFLILISTSLFASAGGKVISVSMNPPNPNFGDLVQITVTYCAQLYNSEFIAVAISSSPAKSSADLSNNGQIFVVSAAGVDVATSLPDGGNPGGPIGWMANANPNGGTPTCTDCATQNGKLFTNVYNVHIPPASDFPGCNLSQLYIHAALKDANMNAADWMAAGDTGACNSEPAPVSWTMGTQAKGFTMSKTASGEVQADGDLVLYSINYTYWNGQLTLTDTIPPSPGNDLQLVSFGPAGMSGGTVTGPSIGATSGNFTWQLPDRTGIPGSASGTVWMLYKETQSPPTMGANYANSAQGTMAGAPSQNASANCIVGQAAISIATSQSAPNPSYGDVVTYYLNYNVNGMQLAAFQSFDDLAMGVYGSSNSIAGSPPTGWRFEPQNGANGQWTISDACNTGDRVITGMVTTASTYPGLLYQGVSGNALCSGIVYGEANINPETNEGADALMYFRNDGNVGGKAYALIISVDKNIGTYMGGHIDFQACTPSCNWPTPTIIGADPQITANQWWVMKVWVDPANQYHFQAKAWQRGSPEPVGYQIDWTDPNGAANGMDCNNGTQWMAGFGEESGDVSSPYVQDSYNNFQIFNPRVSTNTVVWDTIPNAVAGTSDGSITYIGQQGPYPYSGNAQIAKWNLGTVSNEGGTFTWWGTVNTCASITNQAFINGSAPEVAQLSNSIIMRPVCGSPTFTPTFTSTPTITGGSATFTRIDTPTVTMTYTTPGGTNTFTATFTPTATITLSVTFGVATNTPAVSSLCWVDVDGNSVESINVSNSPGLSYDPDIAIDSAGMQNVVWMDSSYTANYQIYYKKWNGSVWVDALGANTLNARVTSFTGGAGRYPKIQMGPGNQPYILCIGYPVVSGTAYLYFAKWNGSAWVGADGSAGLQLIPGSDNASDMGMALDNAGNPQITWYTTNLRVYYQKWSGSAWVNADGTATGPVAILNETSHQPSIALDSTGTPYVAFIRNNYTAALVRWNGLSCPAVSGTGAASINIYTSGTQLIMPRVRIDSLDRPHVEFQNNGIASGYPFFYLWWDGTAWVDASGSGTANALANIAEITFDYVSDMCLDSTGTPYVAMNIDDHNVAVAKWNGTTWTDWDGNGRESLIPITFPVISGTGPNKVVIKSDISGRLHVCMCPWAKDFYYVQNICTGGPWPTATATSNTTKTFTPTQTRTLTQTVTITPTVTMTNLAGSFSATPTFTLTSTVTVTAGSTTPTPPTITMTATAVICAGATPVVSVLAKYNQDGQNGNVVIVIMSNIPFAQAPAVAVKPHGYGMVTQNFTATLIPMTTSYQVIYPKQAGYGDIDTIKVTYTDICGNSATTDGTYRKATDLTGVEHRIFHNVIDPDNGERTRVSYNIYGPGKVKIRVFSKNGVLIKELFNGNVDGKNDQEECSWDGRNTAGKTVASGTYIIIIETDSYTEKAKVAVIR